MMNKCKNFVLAFFLLLFLCPLKVMAAGSASFGFNGPNSVVVGKEVTITMYVGNVNSDNGGVVSLGGNLVFDSNYLQYISGSGVTSPYAMQINPSNSYKFAGLDTTLSNGITKSTTIFTFKFKALKTGSTTIRVNNGMLSDRSAKLAVNAGSKTISIVDAPSSNNFLASLSVTNGTINFNKNTTNYKVNVAENISSVTISASAEDKGAKLSGTGTKSLKYGDNTFLVVVTASSGAKKTYTVVVNRKDNRSSNNNLKSLSLSSGSISFNKNTTTYKVTVPFSVTSVKVDAKAEDSKARVSVSGGNNLVSEKTQNVTIRVTAENGSVKTYTIKVTRGKDPNKPLSNENSLSSLVPSVGNLNPDFRKDVLNYQITVPFDVKEITFKAEATDTTFASVKTDGPETLSVGKNIFKFAVTAEDNSKQVYQVVVTREKDPNGPLSSNTNLASLSVSGGSLTKKFDKNKHVYYYKKGKLKIDAKSEDENSKVVTIENEGIYTVFVESPSGDMGSYVLLPKEGMNIGFIISLIANVGFVGGGAFAGYQFILKKKKLKRRKR